MLPQAARVSNYSIESEQGNCFRWVASLKQPTFRSAFSATFAVSYHKPLDLADPHTTYTDQELLDGFMAGGEKAFKALYDLYFPQVYVYTWKMAGDQEEAKDITIGVFTRLFGKHTDFANLPDIRGFLYTSARNASYTYLQQVQRRSALQSRLLDEFPHKDELPADQITGETLAILFRALEQLPPQSKRVLELLYLDGKAYREAAGILGISVETVKSQRAYGIKKLRELLAGYPMPAALVWHLLWLLKK